MAKLRWAIPCHRVITDQSTNSVSYIDAVEEFAVPELPYPFMPTFIATLWERETRGETIGTRVRLIDPSGNEFANRELDLVHEEAIRHRANLAIGGQTIDAAGRFYVAVDQRVGEEWKEESRFPIDVAVASGA